eukprot:2077029-Ditylum_brightwellii.AAC.1
MSYLSIIMHNPYDYPPETFWERTEFSKDKKVDGVLNANKLSLLRRTAAGAASVSSELCAQPRHIDYKPNTC